MSYLGRSSEFGVRSRYIYTAAGSETSISGADDNNNSLSFTDGAYVDVYLNGVLLVPAVDYNTSTANTIAGLSALSASDVVEIVVYDVFNVADTVPASTGGTFNGNVTATAFYGDGSNLTGLAASFDQLTDTTVSTSDPTVSSNPSATGHLWLNKTSGEVYVCTDATAGANVWTNVGEGTGGIVPTYSLEYAIQAGGGGGGFRHGGGGGAGGYRTSHASDASGGVSSTETPLTETSGSGTVYTITVGAGGSAGPSESNNGSNGEDSSIAISGGSTITALGGGYGRSSGTGSTGNGGCGGGGRASIGSYGLGTTGQGLNGGGGGTNSGGGGGGTADEGSRGDNGSTAGYGGDGTVSTILTTSNATTYSVGEVDNSQLYFGGGGGNGSNTLGSVSGGRGGGGDGRDNNQTGSPGSANTGGGGGGGGGDSGAAGGQGGSGVVILRMPTASYSGTYTGASVSVATEGSDTILIFKSSGSYTA
jgi:hypothetical protein